MVLATEKTPVRTAVDDPASPAVVEAICDYVALPLFRSARIEELVIDDNPYRRPVRPEDLDWLRFDEPLTPATAAKLSALLGHRILLNIYDSERCLLPERMTDEKWHDFDEFYGEATRARGERIRPMLEHHVFDYATQAAANEDLEATSAGPKAVRKLLYRVATRCDQQAEELQQIESSARHPARICRTQAIQLIGQRITAPLRLVAPAVEEDAETSQPLHSFTAGMAVGHSVRVDQVLRQLADQHNLGWQLHQYYQFYLPTTLALINYLSACRRDPTGGFRYIGAMAARTLTTESLIDRRAGAGPRQARRSGAVVRDRAGGDSGPTRRTRSPLRRGEGVGDQHRRCRDRAFSRPAGRRGRTERPPRGR